MFDIFIGLAIGSWALIGIAFLCFIFAIGSYRALADDNGLFKSTFWFLVVIALIGSAFYEPLLKWAEGFSVDGQLDWKSIVVTALKIIGVWVAAGVITAFFYWVSLVRKIRQRFDSAFVQAKADLAHKTYTFEDPETGNKEPWPDDVKRIVARALATNGIAGQVLHVYDNETALLGTPGGDKLLQKLERRTAEVIPPRASAFKGSLIHAAIVWPLTLASLVLADLVQHAMDFLFKLWRGFLDKVSAAVWGSDPV